MQKLTLTSYSEDFKETSATGTELDFLQHTNNVDYSFYKVYCELKAFGIVGIGLINNTAEIHFICNKYGKTIQHKMTELFGIIKQYCKDQGAKELIAPEYNFEPNVNDKWSKFVGKMGFDRTTYIRIAEMEL